MRQSEIRYVALGDSYTSGEGVRSKETYPSLLTSHLKNSGINIQLIANLAVSGSTTDDVLIYQLSIYEKLKPTFATLLIGANDIGHTNTNKEMYQKKLDEIVSAMQVPLSQKDNIILLTIPDFSTSPYGKESGLESVFLEKITSFNNVVKNVAKKRNAQIVQLDNPTLLIDDIHPSAKEYKRWAQKMFPVAQKVLSGK